MEAHIKSDHTGSAVITFKDVINLKIAFQKMEKKNPPVEGISAQHDIEQLESHHDITKLNSNIAEGSQKKKIDDESESVKAKVEKVDQDLEERL